MNLSPYEKALIRAEHKGILIDQWHTSKKVPAAAMCVEDDMGIFIDENAYQTDTERRFAFLHEMAHCETAGFYNEHTPEVEREKIEYKANKRTVAYLVPFNLYKAAIMAGYFNEYEQAEYWNVPIDFVPTIHQTYERTKWEDVQELMASTAEKCQDC